MLQLADAVDITRGHMGNLERGDRELTKPVMDRVAAILGLLPADLLNPDDGGLTLDERGLVQDYRELPQELRDRLRAMVNACRLISSKQ